jgi:uncharacterized protein involved in exopolysaccharide biosynthesis
MLRPADVVTLVLHYRRRFLGAGVLCAALLTLIGVVLPRDWEARSAFTSFQSSTQLPGGVSGLAQQLGVQLPTGGDGGTPLFYSVLIKSKGLLRALVDRPYPFLDRRTARDVGAMLDVDDDLTGDLRREATVEKMLKAISVDLNRESGIVTLTARTRDPKLSLWINQSLLELVDTYYGGIRRTRAGAERRFSEAQRNQAKTEVRAAENALEEFQVNNKNYSNSPVLRTEYERLSREVGLRQTVYSALEQAYYKARLDEVRDTPSISILERPVLPPKPRSRFLALRLGFGFVLGVVLTGLVLLIRVLVGPAFGAATLPVLRAESMRSVPPAPVPTAR